MLQSHPHKGSWLESRGSVNWIGEKNNFIIFINLKSSHLTVGNQPQD